MSKIPKCRLETYWANKDVCTCPKSQNVVWKPTGLTKRFLHVQNSKMSFGNLRGLAKRFLDPKSENAIANMFIETFINLICSIKIK